MDTRTTRQASMPDRLSGVRLAARDIAAIKSAVAEIFGADARVTLFGSRADPARRGGDIDLLVEVSRGQATLESEIRLETTIRKRIGERKVDILLAAPDRPAQHIHTVARKSGVVL